MKTTSLKSSLACRRKAHFEAGGSAKMWRGSACRLDENDSKAQKSKYACRRWKEEQ
jgi:hypothetical protein